MTAGAQATPRAGKDYCPDGPGVRPVRAPRAYAGRARVDRVTKRLAWRLQPGEVAIVAHQDMDGATAWMLASRRPAAVVDALLVATGTRPARGAAVLLEAGIPVLHGVGTGVLQAVQEGSPVVVHGNRLLDGRGRLLARGQLLTPDQVRGTAARAEQALRALLPQFAENTLELARREVELLRMPLPLPPLSTPVAGRPVVVAVRGTGFFEDLVALAPLLQQARPVRIGVDGGADGLLQAGWGLDLIVGDMDSVSDRALSSGAELVVQAYPDGRAPGLARVRRLGLFAHVMPCPGTSEDAALLLAHEAGGRLIVVVGGHGSPADVLEKGRMGMASTLLVRMRVGDRLVDARGFSRLVAGGRGEREGTFVAAAAMAPLAVLGALSEPVRLLLKVMWLRLQMGLWAGFGP